MFLPFSLAALMRSWAELAAGLLRAPAGGPSDSGRASRPAPTGLAPLLQAARDGDRRVLGAVREAQAHLGRAADRFLDAHPAREFLAPLMNGIRMAIRSLLYCAETFADRRAGYLAAAAGAAGR